MIRTIRVLGCFIAAAHLSTGVGPLHADEWPQFRGHTGSGVSDEKNLPVEWAAGKRIVWSVELPGRANSSPAVTRDRIDLTTRTNDRGLWVLSYSRDDGELIHKIKVGAGTLAAPGPENLWAFRHNAATPTPCSDDDHIWAFFGSGLLVCVDAASGHVVWRKDMNDEYGPYDITFGMGSSPRLWGDHVYVACMTKGPSYVVAFDKLTGEEAWKSDRTYDVADDHPDAYSSPVVRQHGDAAELIVSGAGFVDAWDLSSGKRNWSLGGLTIDSPYGRIIASAVPSPDGQSVVATTGNPGGGGLGHLQTVHLGRDDAEIAWKYARQTPDSSTPGIVDDLLYTMTDNGIATCFEVDSGEIVWQERLGDGAGPFHAALVAGDDKVYFLGIDGLCIVVEHGREGKVLARNTLPGTFYATPAISDGILYLRAYERLYAIGDES
ncbi:MAG: hypothetical protein DWQ29_08295 [Planctomycetota bacterium]|nr:MAG: hypothetical protein DWQ29_08295 [Planctomycetota bacterium]